MLPFQLLHRKLIAMGADAFYLPRTDTYLQEFIAPSEAFFQWATRFSGSAGKAIFTPEKVFLFVDGRYTLQAPKEVYEGIEVLPLESFWEHLSSVKYTSILIDPWVVSCDEVSNFQKKLKNVTLKFDDERELFKLWVERPNFVAQKIRTHPEIYAGETSLEKRKRIIEGMTTDALLIPDPESCNWLLNIRGHDVPMTPVALCRILLFKSGNVQVYTASAIDFPSGVLDEGDVVFPETEFESTLKSFSGTLTLIDAQTPYAVQRILEQGRGEISHTVKHPVLPLKAKKNSAEIAGLREAHERDARVFEKFEAWLKERVKTSPMPDEYEIAQKIDLLRFDEGALSPSFETIAGFGGNGAIVHYRPPYSGSARLSQGLLLLDSGGQYASGTTDITRVYAIGEPTERQKTLYKAVYEAYSAVANAIFLKGTTGVQLDALARAPLWRQGLDYQHGTGHGVGAALNVHEAPPSLSKKGTTPLEVGMVVSIEPAVYIENEFGIRLENLALVVEKPTPHGGNLPMLGFEILTKVPLTEELVGIAI